MPWNAPADNVAFPTRSPNDPFNQTLGGLLRRGDIQNECERRNCWWRFITEWWLLTITQSEIKLVGLLENVSTLSRGFPFSHYYKTPNLQSHYRQWRQRLDGMHLALTDVVLINRLLTNSNRHYWHDNTLNLAGKRDDVRQRGKTMGSVSVLKDRLLMEKIAEDIRHP